MLVTCQLYSPFGDSFVSVLPLSLRYLCVLGTITPSICVFLFLKTLLLIPTVKTSWIKEKVKSKSMKITRFDTCKDRNDPVEIKVRSLLWSSYLHGEDTAIRK